MASKEYQEKYSPVVIQTINSILSKEYGNLSNLSDEQINQIYYVTLDRISLKNAELGAKVHKFCAEVHMLGNLLIAFALLSVLSIFYKLSLFPFFVILVYLTFSNLKRHNIIQFTGLVDKFYALHKIESEASAKETNHA